MSLSSLIVQREIATIREVEEALARQVLYGGDLVTNLLEVCRVDEEALVRLVAEQYGISPAPTGELPVSSVEARKLIAGEVALERSLAPLLVDRYGLVVAVAEPLARETEQELTFALALPIAQQLAPLVRIRQALARDYGVALDTRMQRLLHKMLNPDARGLSSFPPPRAIPDFKPPRAPSFAPPPLPRIAPIPSERPRAGGTLVRAVEVPAARAAKRRRGPLTSEIARDELSEVEERDSIFDLVFEFARQFFDYTALFVVHGEIAEGRDAYGDGAARDKVARIGVPLDMPGLLSSARAAKAVVRQVPARDGLDIVLMSDLGRAGRTECAVIPLVVRSRVVALVLGDGGETGIDEKSLVEIDGIVAAGTASFERLIVRRKLLGSIAPPRVGGAGGAGGTKAPPPMSPPPDPEADARRALDAQHDEINKRPSVEELAAPIRELVAEPPPSRVAETQREPSVRMNEVPRGESELPPPANLLAVRKLSARPIPREEPESMNVHPAAAPSALVPSSMLGGPRRTRSGMKRAEAPPLEFNPRPATPPSFGAVGFGNDEAERKLLAEIEGVSAPVPSAPPAPPPSSMSPKAVSPPPPPPSRPSPPSAVTDVSSTGPMLAAAPLPFIEDPFEAMTPVAPAVAFGPGPDLDATPIAPAVALADAPPVAKGSEPFPPAPSASSLEEVEAVPDDAIQEADDAAAEAAPLPLRRKSGSSQKPMPASEQQISVAPHKPPSSHQDETQVLPSVIVDVTSEYVTLVDRVISGPDDDAEAELLRAGGAAMASIMEKFPGPIALEPERLDEGTLPRVAEGGPVIRLVASQRRTAVPMVLSLVEDPNADKRFWATYLLTELVYIDAVDAAVGRLFDPDARVRRAARAACRALAEAHPSAVVDKIEEIAKETDFARERRILAIAGLGETREALAVPPLMALLGDAEPEIASAARSAIALVTRQDLGAEQEKWRAWWSTNAERHRLEWLIDSLMHEQAAIRAAASEELKTITKEYFGYYEDLPKRERERAQARYREWWNNVGRVRFSRAATRGG